MNKKYLLVFTLFLCSFFGFGQIFSDNCSTQSAAGWNFNSVIQNSGYWLLDNNLDYVTSETFGAYDTLVLTSNLRSFGSGTAPSCFIEVSTDGGTSWTGISTTHSGIPNSYTNYIFNIGTLVGSNNKIRWTRSAGARGLRINNLSLTGTPIVTNTVVQFTSTTSSLAEDGLFIDVCASITNEDTINATTVEVALNGSSSATNGIDYDDGAGIPAAISFPQTLTFPANSNANQCFTIFISIDDLLVEGDEIIVLDLQNVSGGNSAALGTNTQHTVTITDNDTAPIADVVITEIMYNSAGTDDEWIEICNISGSTQDLSNYTIDVNTTTRFTFPASTTILDGNCITVSLGSNGDGTYNNVCPFTPDYGVGAGTNFTNILTNSPTAVGIDIELVASDGTSVADAANYDDADGADGNGRSLHVINASNDNSDTGTNWQEVLNGGSPGLNSLISPCTPVGPEINVEANFGAFPDISDEDITPSTLDNTDFGNVNLGSSGTSSFRIENFGGTTDLTITSVTFIGGNAADFSVSLSPDPIIAAGNSTVLEVEFTPSFAGTRTTTLQIINNDSNEGTYNFTIEGNALCTGSSNTISPTSGPANTIVTVTGSDLNTATATYSGNVAVVTNISATQMEVTIPIGETSGNIQVTDDLGCTSSFAFTVIDSQVSGCEGTGGTIPTDLFISEVTDATLGGMSYVELYNGTGATINVDNYSLEVYSNGNATVTVFNTIDLDNVNVPSGGTYVIALGIASSPDYTNPGANTCDIDIMGSPVGNGELANQTTTNGGINKATNGHDMIRLIDSGTTVDEFGVYNNDSWMNSTIITGDRGFNFKRSSSATQLPDPTFTLGELSNWIIVDWVGSGIGSCSSNDYSNIGIFDFSTGSIPTINVNPSGAIGCDLSAQLSADGSEGFNGGGDTKEIEYRWFYEDPTDGLDQWFEILNTNTDYTDHYTQDITINNILNHIDFQYYCQVREDDATCFAATNATRLNVSRTIWDGFVWIGGAPTLSTIAILDGDYNTGAGGQQISFQACQLIINATNTLTVANSTFVEVQNDVTANGDIFVETQGNFVQRGLATDAGSFSGTGTTTVSKTTPNFTDNGTNIHYTYWSSPVENINVDVQFPNPVSNRRFYFDTALYEDMDGDDIDDTAPHGWQPASGPMTVGTGYAIAATLPPGFPFNNTANFVGVFNTGNKDKAIVMNGFAGDNDWNFIGNPYPSAIDFNDLHSANSTRIDGAAFLWSQANDPDSGNPGNEAINFNTDDYAIISAGSGNTAGGAIGLPPNDFIPSGQGFFVRGLSGGTLTFDNSMRVADLVSNNIFFEANNQSMNLDGEEDEDSMPNRLWLDLTSDNGVFNQILMAYVDGATNGIDSWSYDVPRNMSTGTYANFYSLLVDANDTKFVIQGKAPESLNVQETIRLGFDTSIDVVTLYKISIPQLEGDFLTENNIYLKDYLLNTIHNLKESDYNFTSATGTFNERFEIVFTEDTLSTVENTLNDNDLTIIERTNGNVLFKVTGSIIMDTIEIIDLQGRTIYKFKVKDTANAVYDLSTLSNATYIAKVTLEDGRVIIKKDIKRY